MMAGINVMIRMFADYAAALCGTAVQDEAL